MIRAVLFDLDGTLADTLYALGSTVNDVLHEAGLPTHPMDAYRQFVGNGARVLVERAAGRADEALFARFLAEYDRRCLLDTPPYDGVLETLDFFRAKGIQLAVVTNKPHEQAVRLVTHLFGDRFEAVYGSQSTYERKPHPASVHLAAATLGVPVSDCVFVGDSDVDVKTAHAAGIPCIGCCYGFRGEEELRAAGADDFIHSFADLQKNRLIFA